jgi:hypothetical protein
MSMTVINSSFYQRANLSQFPAKERQKEKKEEEEEEEEAAWMVRESGLRAHILFSLTKTILSLRVTLLFTY